MVIPTAKKIKKSKMFSGITNYFWGSPSNNVQEPVTSIQDPDEVFGDLKSMEVTSDLEEGLQTPQSPSDAEEDWVVLSGNGRIIEAPPRADRKAVKKPRNETQVPARDTEVRELDNRLDDLPERVETSLKFKPSHRRDTAKRCARTEVSSQPLHKTCLKPANRAKPAASGPAAMGASEPEAMAVSGPAAIGVSEPAAMVASEPLAMVASESAAMTVFEPEPMAIAEPVAVAVSEPTSMGASEPEAMAVSEPAAMGASEPEAMAVSEPVAVAVSEPAMAASESAAMAVSVLAAEKVSDAPSSMVTEPEIEWKTVRRYRAVGSSDTPAPIETHKNRFYSDVLPFDVESSFEDPKVPVKSSSLVKKTRPARKSLKKSAHKPNHAVKQHVKNVCSVNSIEENKLSLAVCHNNKSETDRRTYKSELNELNKKYRKLGPICTLNREVTRWFSKGNDQLFEYMNMLDKFGKKYCENEKLRLPWKHELLISVLNDRHNSSDLAPKSQSKLEPKQKETLEEKLKEKEREHELALALEELKPAQKALQRQQHEKLSRKYLLKTNLVREVSAAGRSRLRRSDRLNPSMSSGANNNRKCQ